MQPQHPHPPASLRAAGGQGEVRSGIRGKEEAEVEEEGAGAWVWTAWQPRVWITDGAEAGGSCS